MRRLVLAMMMIGLSVPAMAETAPAIPDFGKMVDVSGAQERPDPTLDYHVVFGVTRAAAKPDEPNPTLDRVARFVNLLTHYGVPKEHIHVVAIISGPATPIVKKAADGGAPPDVALIAELSAAGVQVALCSQAASAHGISAADLLPGVRLDVSALTTIATLHARGYAYLPD